MPIDWKQLNQVVGYCDKDFTEIYKFRIEFVGRKLRKMLFDETIFQSLLFMRIKDSLIL